MNLYGDLPVPPQRSVSRRLDTAAGPCPAAQHPLVSITLAPTGAAPPVTPPTKHRPARAFPTVARIHKSDPRPPKCALKKHPNFFDCVRYKDIFYPNLRGWEKAYNTRQGALMTTIITAWPRLEKAVWDRLPHHSLRNDSTLRGAKDLLEQCHRGELPYLALAVAVLGTSCCLSRQKLCAVDLFAFPLPSCCL